MDEKPTLCVYCFEPVKFLPFYNMGEDERYVPSVPFCANPNCPLHGLLTVATTSVKPKVEEEKKETDGKGKHKRIQSKNV